MLDIGTGSGVLAIAAARAGARHVYAVEASDIAEVAERVFALNGMKDRITLVTGWSRKIDCRAGPPDGVGVDRQRAVRGGDPRDDARRAPPPAEAGSATDPERAHALARPFSPRRPRRGNALGRMAVERWRGCTGSTSSRS